MGCDKKHLSIYCYENAYCLKRFLNIFYLPMYWLKIDEVNCLSDVVFKNIHGKFYQSNLALASPMYPKQTGLGDGPVSSPLRTSARPRRRPMSFGRQYVYYTHASSATFKTNKKRTPATRIAKMLRPKKQSMPTANAVVRTIFYISISYTNSKGLIGIDYR